MLTKTRISSLMLATAMVLTSSMLVYADTGTAPAVAAAAAEPSHQAGDWHHGKQGHEMFKVLNLSEDQEKQLKDSREKQKEAMKGVFEQMKSNREAFNAEIIKATPDTAKINDLQTQLKTIQGQMLDDHLNSLLEVKKILTPEQFIGYMTLKREKELRMHHGHKGGFGKGKDGDDDRSSND